MPSRPAQLLAALCTVLTLLSGCGSASGVDGDLRNQWPAMAAPAGWEPKAGACHAQFATTTRRESYTPVSCTTYHSYETVYIGQFTGSAAALSTPPHDLAPEMAPAWSECDKKVTEFLGGDWREGKIWIAVSTPSAGNWQSGARWFQCVLAEREDLRGNVVVSSMSLKGEFAKDSMLKYRCYTYGTTKKLDDISCADAHDAEFVGSATMDVEWSKLGENLATVHQKCRSAIAAYVGVPDDSTVQNRTGTVYSYPKEVDWRSGDRSVRCFLWLDGTTVARSLKGTGTSGLPIRRSR